MIHRKDLLDPNSVDKLTEEERRVLDGAQNAGHGPRHLNTGHSSGGAMEQVILPSALIACGGGLGSDSDFSEGCSTLREIFEEIAEEMALEGTVD